MHSFIIVAHDIQKRKEYIADFCRTQQIGKFDQKLYEPVDASFGVALIRELQTAAFFKPIQSTDKAIILENAETLTTEAQNALLKILEEPPLHTFIFLSCATDAYFLPTILSRCKEIHIADIKKDQSSEKNETLTHYVQVVTTGSLGEKLALAEEITAQRDVLMETLVGIITILRERMVQDTHSPVYPHLLTGLQRAYQLIETTNVTPRMILEHTFLEL